jgi:hypothetical protein
MLFRIDIDVRIQHISFSRELTFGDMSTPADPSVDAVDISFADDLTSFTAKH